MQGPKRPVELSTMLRTISAVEQTCDSNPVEESPQLKEWKALPSRDVMELRDQQESIFPIEARNPAAKARPPSDSPTLRPYVHPRLSDNPPLPSKGAQCSDE